MVIFFSITDPGTGTLQRTQAIDIVLTNYFWITFNKENSLELYLYPSTLN